MNTTLPIAKLTKRFSQQLLPNAVMQLDEPIKLFANPNYSLTNITPLTINQNHFAANQGTATIQVSYNGLPPQAIEAVQYAVSLWATLIASPVPIKLQVNWTALADFNVLAQNRTYQGIFTSNLPATSKTWYTSSQMGKLLGKRVDPTILDAIIDINSNFAWYLGTDGNTLPGQFDLVTAVMHELAHSFLSSSSTTYDFNTGLGQWGTNGSPGLYDRFVVNGFGQSLINTQQFPNPSMTLGAQLIGNNLFFNGKNARVANGGINPKLYAPSAWINGSSYIHLDEATYGLGNPNSLITPFLNVSEAIHYPGSVGLGIFQDLGWIDQKLVGNQRGNVLIAEAGNDNLTGLAGNDRLVGLGGSDKIVGGDGNDTLIGGIGNTTNTNSDTRILNTNGFDLLIGGRGKDIFALESGVGYVDIRDFRHAQQDKLGLARGLSLRSLSVYDSGRDLWVIAHQDLLAILRNVQQLAVFDLVKL